MTVGILSVEIIIPSAASLKEKRKIVLSIKDRLRKKFNVSVAETGYQDKWQRSLIGIAVISEKRNFVDECLNKAFDFLDNEVSFEIVKYNFEYV
jgi:uncharacterized protein YlxP (DUF503 family)